MRLNIALVIIVVTALLLQGCGRKGPLKLPSQPPKPPASTSPQSGK